MKINEHFYQLAVQHGRDHAQVVQAIAAANLVLLALALAAVTHPGPPWAVPWTRTKVFGLASIMFNSRRAPGWCRRTHKGSGR